MARSLVTVVGWSMVACLDRPLAAVSPQTQSAVQFSAVSERMDKVDLLIVVDNSNSMAGNQANLMAQLGPMIDELVSPRCSSRSNPAAPLHACDSNNPDDVRTPPVKDLHVGVISSDLGTAGFNVCTRSVPDDSGDDGLLNPIRFGAALQGHQPWAAGTGAPAGFRPASCGTDAMRFPSFIGFCSNEADASCDIAGASASTRSASEFSEWFKCNAGLFINGCGLEQPLEAAWRALVHHDARTRPGNASRNANFLRDDALLAVIVLSDEEDGSTRLCDRDEGFSTQNNGACVDARSVFDDSSRAWGATDLNSRFYLYRPGSEQDPTFSIDRYYNRAASAVPNRWSRDLLSLKPGHPERIVFAAITGVPLAVPTRAATSGEQVTDWDALLGAPSANGADDFVGRNPSAAVEGTQSNAGTYSMRGGSLVAGCEHVAPACRREGSTPDPSNACAATLTRPGQYMAFPSRRIVELARRFDEAPSCDGLPCRNGIVTSICSSDYRGAMGSILRKIQQRLESPCLARVLDTSVDAQGAVRATCIVREAQPEGVSECDASRGRVPVGDGRSMSEDGRLLCEVSQVSTFADGAAMAMSPVDPSQAGWFYDRRADAAHPACRGSVQFTVSGQPRAGARVLLECVQRVESTGVNGGGSSTR